MLTRILLVQFKHITHINTSRRESINNKTHNYELFNSISLYSETPLKQIPSGPEKKCPISWGFRLNYILFIGGKM